MLVLCTRPLTSLGTRPFAGEGRVWAHVYIRVVPAECNYAWVISNRWRHHAYVHCLSARCSPQVLGLNMEQRSDLPYLVAGNTESLEKNHFHDVICNQQFWLARSTFRPGDNSNVGECPDPSSSCEGSGSETTLSLYKWHWRVSRRECITQTHW